MNVVIMQRKKTASRTQTVDLGCCGCLLPLLSNRGTTRGQMQRRTHHKRMSHVFTPAATTRIKTESISCSLETPDFPSWSISCPCPRRKPSSDLSLRPLPSLELRMRGITVRGAGCPGLHSFIPEHLPCRSQKERPPYAPIPASVVVFKPHRPL